MVTDIIELLTSANSLQAVGLIALLWFGSKLVDIILELAIQRKVFNPIYRIIRRKVKSALSWREPISTDFEISYRPNQDLNIEDARDVADLALKSCEEESKGKISVGDLHWSSEERLKGSAKVDYIDGHYPYDVEITLSPDTEEIRDPGSEGIEIHSISFNIEFRYPFYRLEDALFNLDSFFSFLESGLEKTIAGSFSGGRFVITPVSSDLSLDEWIEKDRFEPSLLLSSQDETAEVEFFQNRAVVSTSYTEVDSETVGYIRAILLNYYLET